jgi:hypothetical protein
LPIALANGEPFPTVRRLLHMDNLANEMLLAFKQEASAIRRERADLEARLARLSAIRAETEKLLAESKKRIDGLLGVLDESPSVVPEPSSSLDEVPASPSSANGSKRRLSATSEDRLLELERLLSCISQNSI